MRELTLSEAAVQTGRAASTLRNLINRGRLRARLVGKTYVITQREVDRYVRDVRRRERED